MPSCNDSYPCILHTSILPLAFPPPFPFPFLVYLFTPFVHLCFFLYISLTSSLPVIQVHSLLTLLKAFFYLTQAYCPLHIFQSSYPFFIYCKLSLLPLIPVFYHILFYSELSVLFFHSFSSWLRYFLHFQAYSPIFQALYG